MENINMEEIGEKPINKSEIVGEVLIKVYNDCFTLEYTAGMEQTLVAVLEESIDRLIDETENRVLQ